MPIDLPGGLGEIDVPFLRHDAKLAPDAMLAISVTAAYGDGRPPKLPRAVKRARRTL